VNKGGEAGKTRFLNPLLYLNIDETGIKIRTEERDVISELAAEIGVDRN